MSRWLILLYCVVTSVIFLASLLYAVGFVGGFVVPKTIDSAHVADTTKVLTTKAGIRLGCLVGIFAAMAVWELVAPRRALHAGKPLRWGSNLGLVFLNSLLLRFIAPLGAVGIALFAESRGWGLFHYVDAPYWLAIVVSVVLLDFAIYLQHVMFHAVPLLWRLHMVHHADLDFDVTTGLRFHTVEILLSFGIKAAVVLLLGPPAVAVLIFEVLLNATSVFNHSNVRMPHLLDRVLRWLVVTPDMHRVHHSVFPQETNSNFGFNLPWWDRLLGTYRDQPADGHAGMTIGLTDFRDELIADRLHRMLLLPFTGHSGEYPINRRDSRSSTNDEGPSSAHPLSEPIKASAEHLTNPMDRLATEYDCWFDSSEGTELFRIELACVQDVISDKEGRWLEVGVGTGRFAAALGIREGIDPSEPALVLARSREIDARQGTAEQLPYSKGTFDGILLAATLCFVADPRVAMREFRRVIKPGGRLVIGMIPADSPWGELYAEKGRQSHRFYSRAHFHTVNEVIALAEDSGFTFARACSCLLTSPNSPQTHNISPGIVQQAGFVCLEFSAEEPNEDRKGDLVECIER